MSLQQVCSHSIPFSVSDPLGVTATINSNSATTPPTDSNAQASPNNVGLIAGATVGFVLLVICLPILSLVFRFRQRRKKEYQSRFPDVTFVQAPSEIPRPLPLPQPEHANHFLPRSKLRRSSVGPSTRNQQITPGRWGKRQIALSFQDACIAPSEPAPPVRETALNLPVEGPSYFSTRKEPPSDRNLARPLSVLIISHDDSGVRLSQPGDEQEVDPVTMPLMRQVIELPPTYAP